MKNPETQKRNGVNCWEKKNTHTRGGTHLRNNENKTKRRERERERERETKQKTIVGKMASTASKRQLMTNTTKINKKTNSVTRQLEILYSLFDRVIFEKKSDEINTKCPSNAKRWNEWKKVKKKENSVKPSNRRVHRDGKRPLIETLLLDSFN